MYNVKRKKELFKGKWLKYLKKDVVFLLFFILLLFILNGIIITQVEVTEVYQKSVNVKTFGAKGDGVTNDTAALQAALNYSLKGKKVFLPKGTYLIDYLTVPKNVKLEGESGSRIIANGNMYSEFIRISGNNVELKGLEINGDGRRSIGLSVGQGSQNIIIHGCSISNINSTKLETTAGIKVEGNTNDVLIQNNSIDGIYNKPNGKESDNAGTSRGIWIGNEAKGRELVEPKNIKIDNNVISNIYTREDGDGISVQGWDGNVDVSIINNLFKFCSKRAIKIMSPGVLVQGNVILNSYTHASDYNKVMYSFISVYASDVIIEGNQMLGGNSYHGIDIGTDLSESTKRIKVTNNEIVLSEKGIKTFLGGIAMYTNVEDVYLSGNIIKNTNTGIFMQKNIKGCIITSNSISNVSERGITISSFKYRDISDIVISNNEIESTKEAIILQAGKAVVSGNSGRTSSKAWPFITIAGKADVRLKGNLPDVN